MNDFFVPEKKSLRFDSCRTAICKQWLTFVISSCTVSNIPGCALTFSPSKKIVYNLEAVNFSTRVYQDLVSRFSASTVHPRSYEHPVYIDVRPTNGCKLQHTPHAVTINRFAIEACLVIFIILR